MGRLASVVVAGALLLARPAAVGQSPAPQRQPTFRAQTSLVPIDVRVLDRNGRPILDLKASDFRIEEDDAAQKVGHFSVLTLSPETQPPGAGPVRRTATAETAPLAPQTRRLFLITFGRGRLQHPSMGVDGAMRFVSERLLPQDQVAVMAYNRATDFTTDRARIGQVLERFKTSHEAIEAKLRQHFSGWSAVYKGPELPPEVQRDIDEMFKSAGAPGVRELPPGRVSDAAQLAQDDRRTRDKLQRAAILRERAAAAAAMGKPVSEFDKRELAEIEASGLSLDEYVAANRQTMQDLGRLYAGLDYLRYIDGEKHIIFVTEQGLFLPRVESDLSFAAAANHARVAVDIIQTGGQATTMKQAFKSPGLDPLMIIDVTKGEPLQQRFVVGSLRTMSELTGGQASVYDYADKALERIAQATSAGYLLGYYPSNPVFDGGYRRIKITVNRPGATVLYRHGYFAEAPRTPIDRRRAVTYNRIASAVNYPQEIRDLRLTLKTTEVRAGGRAPDLVAAVTIDAATVGFTVEDGLHKAGLDVAVFCQDADMNPVGDLWQKIDLKLSDTTRQRMMRDGIPYSGRVPVKGLVKFVKIVVYDYGSDRIGALMSQIR